MSGARRAAGLPVDGARRRARAAERSKPFQILVRLGFLSRGATYGVIGGLAIALAAGAGTDGAAPDQQGALTLIVRAPLGVVALTVIAAGLLAYAIWKLVQAAAGHGPEGGGGSGAWDRVADGAGGVAYLVFFAVALRTLSGGGGNGGDSHQSHQAAAGALGWPGGPWLVGAGGLVLIAISAYQIWDAASGGFAEQAKTAEMSNDERRSFLMLGRIGVTARALVFALVGYFVLRTAIDYNPRSAVGVDGALARLHHQAFGPWLVGLTGLGLLVFSAFSLFESRYRRL